MKFFGDCRFLGFQTGQSRTNGNTYLLCNICDDTGDSLKLSVPSSSPLASKISGLKQFNLYRFSIEQRIYDGNIQLSLVDVFEVKQ